MIKIIIANLKIRLIFYLVITTLYINNCLSDKD